MANYIVEPSLLLKYLPYKTEIDTYMNNVYISLVGFLFSETSVLGFRIPFHINFEEVNLRFYVRYNDNGRWKRGVVFIKEIVPKPAITFVANNLYRENYCAMPMKHEWKEEKDAFSFNYQWKYKNKWNSMRATTGTIALPMPEGSEADFIAEHYWGYSRFNDKTTFEYEVQHIPWKVFPLNDYEIDCDFEELYGKEFSFLKNLKPASIFVTEGSKVAVLNKKKII